MLNLETVSLGRCVEVYKLLLQVKYHLDDILGCCVVERLDNMQKVDLGACLGMDQDLGLYYYTQQVIQETAGLKCGVPGPEGLVDSRPRLFD